MMPNTKTTKQLYLPDGRKITYTLTRKRVKNLNLRVRSDGSVAVSAPPHVPEREIEAFLKRRAAFVASAIERFAKRRDTVPVPQTFADGERLRAFGEDWVIRVEKGDRICGACSEKTLFLTVKDPADEAQRRRAAEQWAVAFLTARVAEYCRRAERDFAPYGVLPPTVRFRRMISRWGSCNTRRAVLTFNYALIGAPPEAVEYVVYHEFAHLLYPNHSPAFYEQVAAFLPDWKARRAMLKAVPCKFF